MCPFYAWQSNTSFKKYRSNHSKNNSLTLPRPFLERSGGKNIVFYGSMSLCISPLYPSIILCFNVIHFNIYLLISLACIYLSTYLTIYCLSINQSINELIYRSTYLAIYFFFIAHHLSVYLSVHPSICLSIHLSFHGASYLYIFS